MIHIWIYLTIHLTQINTTHRRVRIYNWICNLFMPHKKIFDGFLLQVARASYINQVLTQTLHFKIKLIKFPNIHFSIFYLHLLYIFRCPFKVSILLYLYFETIHFLLPFRKPCFNLFPWFSLIPKWSPFIFLFSYVHYHKPAYVHHHPLPAYCLNTDTN